MGFPVELITVTNPNDIVSRTFKSGDWRMNKDVKATWASAMDIQVNMNYYQVGLYFKECLEDVTACQEVHL